MIEYAQQGKFFLKEYSYFYLAVFSRDFFEQSKYCMKILKNSRENGKKKKSLKNSYEERQFIKNWA